MDRFLRSSFVAIREDRFYGDHYRVVILTIMRQIVHIVLTEIQTAHIPGELLAETCAKFIGIRCTIFLRVSVIAKAKSMVNINSITTY